jgi:short-subunit dehydrogenase
MVQKKIIIVGATSGIGKKMAELYIGKGHMVGITGRRLDLLQQIKQQFPQEVEYECFDVTEKENIRHIQSLIDKLNGLDILVISAGTGEVSKELDWKIDKRTIETNVNGFAEIANWTFNFFIKQDQGRLAVISSIGAVRGNSWAPAYNAAKAFQSTYFEGLAIKARRLKKNVSVTCIEPGFVNTKMAKGNKFFWVVPVEKAAGQIIKAIEKKKRKVYVSRRWWIIAKLLKWMPYFILKRLI